MSLITSQAMLKPGWTKVKFGEVVRLCKEKSANPEAGGIDRYVGLEHIEPEDLRIRRWGLVAEGTTFTSRFKPGQVLFGKRRAYQRKVAVADFEGVCSGDIYVFESANPKHLLPELLPFICQTEQFFNYAVETSMGSLSPRTNWKHLEKFEFHLPSIDEQRQILAALESVSRNEDNYRQALETASKLRTSIRLDKFNPEKYKPRPLKELCSNGKGIQIGPFGAQLHQSDYVDAGVPVVMPANMHDDRIDTSAISFITEDKAESLSVHRVQPGDVLLPRRGDLNRRAYVEDGQQGWLCGTGSIRVRAEDENLRKAIFYALASAHCVRWIEGNAVGTTMLNLNTKIVSNIPIALPPNKDDLETVVSTLDSLEENVISLNQRMSEAQNLKRRILSQVSVGV